jgi:hypothetical protein
MLRIKPINSTTIALLLLKKWRQRLPRLPQREQESQRRFRQVPKRSTAYLGSPPAKWVPNASNPVEDRAATIPLLGSVGNVVSTVRVTR